MFLYRVLEQFNQHRVQYALAGGWAVSLHGAVRGTVDIDFVLALTKENFQNAENALNGMGLESRLPVSANEVVAFRKEYIQKRKMLAWRFMNPHNPAEIVDLLITEDLNKLKKKVLKIGNHSIPLVSIDDLIRMKKCSARPQDLEDIKALEVLKK